VLAERHEKRRSLKEVIIHAASLARAQEVADLIYAAMCLDWGEQPEFGRREVLPADPEEAKQLGELALMVRREKTAQIFGVPRACVIATKASRRKVYQYALHKYLLSHHVMPLDSRLLDPARWERGPAVSSAAGHHVSCAYAIIAAYSVLEELALELRASKDKPSMIRGKWNPVVKNELESRLRASGIDLSETIIWHLRGIPTRIERRRGVGESGKAPWAYGEIRDRMVNVVDAIAYASWLRSRVSSHRLGEAARSLTHYDVANVQHLARRLRLETLGCWQ
jgi:hypothetical protein